MTQAVLTGKFVREADGLWVVRYVGAWESLHYRDGDKRFPIRSTARGEGVGVCDPRSGKLTSLVWVLKGSYRNGATAAAVPTASVVEWEAGPERGFAWFAMTISSIYLAVARKAAAFAYDYVTSRTVTGASAPMSNQPAQVFSASEVELLLYKCPLVAEACIIAAKDAYRGETVKAVVVLRAEARAAARPEDIIAWAREHMAAYKVPKIVEFVDALPKSGSGKVMWRLLQDEEAKRASTAS